MWICMSRWFHQPTGIFTIRCIAAAGDDGDNDEDDGEADAAAAAR